MRILQIHNYYAIRGGECWVVDSEKELLESRGHKVLQFIRNSQAITGASAVEKAYAYWHIPWNPAVAQDLNRILSDFKPHIAHVHNVFPLLSPSIYGELSSNRIPTVQTVHNFRFLCPCGTFFTHGEICERCQSMGFGQAVKHRCVRNSMLTSLQYSRAVRRMWKTGMLKEGIDRYVALNQFSRMKLIAGGIPAGKVSVCGNFSTEILQNPCDKEDYFLYLGRLSTEKGVLTLVSAVRRMNCIRLRIAGSGPLEGEVRRAAARDGNIEFIGYIEGERKNALIAGARAMILPSEWYENFPISVVESMSLATPVIASRIGGLPEMVEHKRTGMLFEPGDVAGLAECLRALSDNAGLAGSMSHAALRYAQHRYDSDQHGMRLENIYADAIAVSSRENT